MSKPVRCAQCTKKTATLHARGAPDGRPQYRCGNCGHRWTEGNPYSEPGGSDRLIMISSYGRNLS